MMSDHSFENDWQFPEQLGSCDVCGVSYIVAPGKIVGVCPNCLRGTVAIVDRETVSQMFTYPPEAVIPIVPYEIQFRVKLRAFVDSIPFKPLDLTVENLEKRLQQVFMPLWWVDADVEAQWGAEVGFDYEVYSHREVYKAGWQTQRVKEERVRWEPRVGHLNRHYENIPAPALADFQLFRRQTGTYPLGEARPYTAELVENALIRIPEREPADANSDAIELFKVRARQDCQKAAEAQHIRDYRWTARYNNHNWTQALLPTYVTFYLGPDGGRYKVVINGYDGTVTGQRRANLRAASYRSFSYLGIGGVLFIIGLLLLLIGGDADDPLFQLAGVPLVLGCIIAMYSVVPFWRAYSFNRR